MAKSLGGKIAKLVSVIAAALLVLAMSFAFVGCETKRPEISVKISFNEETYELEYKLYRNMYPQTVAHYLELIDMKYFDGTVIHDYRSDRMVGGGYYYDGEDVVDDLVEKDYDAATKDENGNVTLKNVSVWADAEKTTAYNTLYGEGTNQLTIENNGLTNQLGALGTYYYTPLRKSDDLKVYVQKNDTGEMVERDYCYNSATSLFYLFTGSSGSNPEFCTFGVLNGKKYEERFQELLDAIKAYTLDVLNGGDEEGTEVFTTEETMTIEDEYWDESSYEDVSFSIPRAKIVIEQVKVLKY